MLVGAEEILRTAVDVREVAAATTRDEDFLADAVGPFEDGDTAPAFAGFGGAEESCSAGAENDRIEFVSHCGQARNCLSSNCTCVRETTR